MSSFRILDPFSRNPIFVSSSRSDPVTEAEITLVNKEDSEDGTPGSWI